MTDYAKTAAMDGWLRHPVLGDPSFDTFEKLGGTVHRSEPPYEWAVNGSLFCDFDGRWYLYAGLYPHGYAMKDREFLPSRFIIYRSDDKGGSWEYLGPGFEPGFIFEGHSVPSDSCPDVVIVYDPNRKKYLLTYDWCTNNSTWQTAHDPRGTEADSGSALAWADSPAGPFTRIPAPYLSNKRQFGCLGRFKRMYAATVLPRERDYLALILCDSSAHFAWGLACMTAPEPEGPWSTPHMLLSVDQPGYYPAPVEFYPAFTVDGTVYAPATSVAMNRNFQAVFSSPLEKAHDPAAWELLQDGNAWHAHQGEDEAYGIWGQTCHGFVERDTGRFVVMYPSKDVRDYGTLSVASRRWDQPYSDGFVLSAHSGPSVSVLRAAYADFSLEAEFELEGTAVFALRYRGILGPNDSTADSVPDPAALRSCVGVRVKGDSFWLLTLPEEGPEEIHAEGELGNAVTRLSMVCRSGVLSVSLNGRHAGTLHTGGEALPLALILSPHSRLFCSRFAVEGDALRYTLCYNAKEGLLSAGQRHPVNAPAAPDAELPPDVWFPLPDGGFAGHGHVSAKWNFIGDSFTICTSRHPCFGVMGVWLDGNFVGSADLKSDEPLKQREVFGISGLPESRHAVRVEPLEGRIAIGCLQASGSPRGSGAD